MHLLFIGGQRSMLIKEEMITNGAVIIPRSDASNQLTHIVMKTPSTKSIKQPKLCTTHYRKQECNFKLHSSSRSKPNFQDNRTPEKEDAMYNILNLSAAFSTALLPTFYILFINILH